MTKVDNTTVLEIWADNYVEADWFAGLNRHFAAAPQQMLSARGSNPAAVDDLLVYDRPDIVLVRNGQPVLVVEKTREVPTGHNVGQRVARLVRSVERRVPTIKFFPFDAMKHGTYANMCFLNIRLLAAFQRMSDIHDVPMLAINWPIDGTGELVIDGSENDQITSVLEAFVDHGMRRWWPGAHQVMDAMQAEHARRLARDPRYGTPPKSAATMRTVDLLPMVEAATHLSTAGLAAVLNRDDTVVYRIAMTPEKARREDPYTGTQFIYDYTECRTGPAVSDKARNLVLWFPGISEATWRRLNPNDPTRKSSNWYLTANALVFSDGWISLRSSTP